MAPPLYFAAYIAESCPLLAVRQETAEQMHAAPDSKVATAAVDAC